MITDERLNELHEMFWSETNEDWTQEWRDELTEDENGLVNAWDEKAMRGLLNLCNEILKLQNSRESGTHNNDR